MCVSDGVEGTKAKEADARIYHGALRADGWADDERWVVGGGLWQ
jgi:hypothetical protein